MEVRKKRTRGFKKEAQGVQVSPLNPLSVAPWSSPALNMQCIEGSSSVDSHKSTCQHPMVENARTEYPTSFIHISALTGQR